MFEGFELSLLIFGPLVLALGLLLVPQNISRWVALGFGVLVLAMLAWVWGQFDASLATMQLVEVREWLPAWGIAYRLGMDGIALPLVALNVLLVPICVLASWRLEKNPRAFYACFLALCGLVNGVFLAQDFVLFYFFWEAMLIPMFLLIGMWGGENRIYAALKFFIYTFVGSVLMLVAGIWLGLQAGSFALGDWVGLGLPLMTQCLLFIAFFAAFAVKVPMWPFHTWLPDAHVQAPTAGSVLLAGILLKMGGYGFLRFCLPMLPEGSAYFAPFVFSLSAIAVVYAALVAWVQTDIKRMIAYSSVSHMGLVTLAIFAGTTTALHGGMMVMVNHGIVSAGLFLAVGVIYERLHTRELANFGAVVRWMPQFAFVSMVLMLAAVALPGTNSFVGEFLALAGSFATAPWFTAVATTGVIFGAVYMLAFYRGIFYGEPSDFVRKHEGDLVDLRWPEWLAFMPLLVLVVVLGVFPSLAMDLWRAPVEKLSRDYLPVLEQRLVMEKKDVGHGE
ncbi:MAG: NADH-quinone oxidoreductase subunit M [Proteobacteria bacterium]|nr:NADH-quinone oxidoreductase subunit M [Pseudomonadota bacterium]